MSSVLIEQPNYVLRVSGREFSLITRALMGSLQEMAIKESDSTREKKRKRERVKRINERMQNEPRSAYEAKETRKKEVELEDGRKVRKYINDADAAMKLGEKLLSQRCNNIKEFHDYALKTIENSVACGDLWKAASREMVDELKYKEVGPTPQVGVVVVSSEE